MISRAVVGRSRLYARALLMALLTTLHRLHRRVGQCRHLAGLIDRNDVGDGGGALGIIRRRRYLDVASQCSGAEERSTCTST